MDLKNWRENIAKVSIVGKYSKQVIIPTVIANEMGLDESSYVYMKYDEKAKSLTIKKSEKGSE